MSTGSTPKIPHSTSPDSDSIWDKQHRTLTLGSIIAVTIVAFRGLAMATVAPIVADDLNGNALYGWIFSAFILAQIMGTVIGGQEVDRRPPAHVFIVAIGIFAVGCLIAGSAPSIYVLLLGRALQGFGAGATFSCVYAIISSVYEDHLRPAMLAAMSSAWIIPSLIGPALAGLVADHFGWRFVFFGLLPILIGSVFLTMPIFLKLEPPTVDPGKSSSSNRVLQSVVLAVGTGLMLAGFDLGPWPIAAVTIVAGLALVVPMLKALLPSGTFSARPMVPAAIVARATCFAAFLITETYMVRALKEFGGVSATIAGIVITAGSLTWTLGSFVQARWDRTGGVETRPLRILTGSLLLLVSVGTVFLSVALFEHIGIEVALIVWMGAGLGIGIAYTTATTIAFAFAPKGEDGKVSSSLLLGENFLGSFGVGIGGAVYAIGQNQGAKVETSSAFALALGVIFAGFALITGLRLMRDRLRPIASTLPV
ncbi:MAG: MFS transporter [Thermomicrobiales bacterium]